MVANLTMLWSVSEEVHNPYTIQHFEVANCKFVYQFMGDSSIESESDSQKSPEITLVAPVGKRWK